MKFIIFFGVLCFYLCICVNNVFVGGADMDSDENDDFAEFEDFDADDEYKTVSNSKEQINLNNKINNAQQQHQQSQQQQQQQKDKFDNDFEAVFDDDEDDDEDDDTDGIVEEESEFEHFHDEEEFEGFHGKGEQSNSENTDQKTGEPKLTMAKVPLHFRTHWDSFWMEMLMLAGLMTYFANYFVGKNKNTKIAQKWLQTHKSLLDDNFALVGDDGKLENECPGLMKETDSLYTLWCSGRTCCEGMLVELKMIKRQDLVAIIADLMRPSLDQLHFKIEISNDSMDPFVFCVGSRRTTTKFFKELYDLSKYCILVNKPVDKYNVPNGFSVLSEIPEATSAMLDSRVILALSKFCHLIDYIHISDQYNGVIQQEDPSNLNLPECKKMLMAGFNLPSKTDMESAKPLLVLVLYILERLSRFRLSKEGKSKAEKNRLRVEEEFLKSTHVARAEAAAARREEKRKQEKERVMADEDPEKQRRWEKKEQKRQLKKKAPKMKQLSIKAL